ncbi:MAG: hypothetical protein WCS49_00485 [Bacilli bacterium]
MEFNIQNTSVYGLEKAYKASGNPMRTMIDNSEVTEKDKIRSQKLGGARNGLGHDNFLKGILVQMDVTAPLYWWKQAQRYHWFDYVSSQSTMHCLLKFNLGNQCVSETNSEVIKIIELLKEKYLQIPDDSPEKLSKWHELVASLPCGFCLGATMTTNYQQLKTMYIQRRTHRLNEWHVFCEWCETLPDFLELTNVKGL